MHRTLGMSIFRTDPTPADSPFIALLAKKTCSPSPHPCFLPNPRSGRGQISVLRSFTVPAGCLSVSLPTWFPAKVCSTATCAVHVSRQGLTFLTWISFGGLSFDLPSLVVMQLRITWSNRSISCLSPVRLFPSALPPWGWRGGGSMLSRRTDGGRP